MVPLQLGRPVWVDDPHFNLGYHLRHPALASPGGDRELRNLVGRVMSQQLDRHKPLWEMWMVEGLDQGHWALVSKVQENQGALSAALSRLMVVVERYPELKANQNFLTLQAQLEGTENRIAVARRDYIQAVQTYNTETRTFPGRLWAIVYGAKPMATFTTTEENQRPPQVKF